MDNRNTRQFDLAAIKRVPVEETSEARLALRQSSTEAVKFPHALSEVFGEKELDVVIKLSAIAKHEQHIAADEDEQLLVIDIDPGNFHILLNMPTLHEERVGRQAGFQARTAALDIAKMYQHHQKMQERIAEGWA